MKSWSIQEEFGIDRLQWVETPVSDPGIGQVLIRIRALSLNYRDLLIVRGDYNPKLPRPMRPLSDCAGEVVSLGPGVTRFQVGDRVAAIFMQRWIEGLLDEEKMRSALGGAIQGVAGEYATFDDQGLVAIPDHLSFEEAATLPCAAVTAWQAIFGVTRLARGSRVLLLGTGGVSIFALQFARLAGAHTTITSSSDVKLQRAQELGADEGINYKTNPMWEKVARGADLVVEVGGPGTLQQSIRAVRPGGAIALIGTLAAGADINPTPILMKGIRLQGIFVGSRTLFEEMNRVLTLHKLRPVIDKMFTLAQLPDALRYMESRAHFGKIVLTA